MAKAVSHAAVSVLESHYGIDKERRYIACDDGTTYVFERARNSPRWRAFERVGADGERSREPSRLPACVEAHMDGHTRSGPRGADGDAYWV